MYEAPLMVKNCIRPRTQSVGNPKMLLTIVLASQTRGRHAALPWVGLSTMVALRRSSPDGGRATAA